LALIEGGGFATAFSSGLAAETMLFLTLLPREDIIIPDEVYGGTLRLLKSVFAPYNINFSQTDFSSEEKIRSSIKPSTKYFFIEALTNPSLIPIDLSLIEKISKETNIPFIADMTFCPPCTMRAFSYNAYAIIHSLSKYISGHNDVLGGAIITKNKELHEKLSFLQRTLGAVLAPDECYRTIQGIKTLQMRWKHVSKTALVASNFLSQHDKISRVLYPGLQTYKGHEIAKKQMQNGYGGVLSFEIDPKIGLGNLKAFVDSVQSRGVINYGESLAAPQTLLAYPYTMSHGSLSESDKESLGITPYFFRLSVGFESPRDIIKDLERGLSAL
ncbi:PLP-dependent transferase, partial [Candidatus Pacearchaeota archaeon]|nr:PLP-dependent transferase [Candidatus Pacearchaeota archaeon]